MKDKFKAMEREMEERLLENQSERESRLQEELKLAERYVYISVFLLNE
jgi:hypothetical protein